MNTAVGGGTDMKFRMCLTCKCNRKGESEEKRRAEKHEEGRRREMNE